MANPDTEANSSILSVESVSRSHGDNLILNKLSLSCAPGEITALIGPSGCGKSTLLKLCNGLLRPDSGSVTVFNAPIDYRDLPGLRRRMGYAVQGTGLFPHLTARENITLLAVLEGWDDDRIDMRLRALLQLNRLEDIYLERYPYELSGGQQQRVGLCRTMMLAPEILLLDEPFAAIDPLTRADIHAQFLAAHTAEPSAVLLVTHDIREALYLADHIAIMNTGEITYRCSKAEIYQQCGPLDAEDFLQQRVAVGATT